MPSPHYPAGTSDILGLYVPASLTGLAGGGVTGRFCASAGADANAIRSRAETKHTITSHQSGHAEQRNR